MSAAGRVLVICTGNVCRSPYIERVLRSALSGTGIDVTSAGTGALVGARMQPGSTAQLARLDISDKGFRAQQVNRAQVERADLIIAASRAHVGEVARYSPLALRRGFALLDLADLLSDVDAAVIAAAPGETRPAQVAHVAAARRSTVPTRSGADPTIVDPYGGDDRLYAQMAEQVQQALPPIMSALRA